MNLGTTCGPFPTPPIHHLWCRWLTSSFPVVKTEPLNNSFYRRIRRRCDGTNHLHGWCVTTDFHGAFDEVSRIFLFYRMQSTNRQLGLLSRAPTKHGVMVKSYKYRLWVAMNLWGCVYLLAVLFHPSFVLRYSRLINFLFFEPKPKPSQVDELFATTRAVIGICAASWSHCTYSVAKNRLSKQRINSVAPLI